MRFFSLIIRNIFRHRSRTILTITGISLSIATIVIFSLVADGLSNIFATTLKPGQSDFSIVREGSADIVLSFLKQSDLEAVRDTPGVTKATPTVFTALPTENSAYFIVLGADTNELAFLGVSMRAGHAPTTDNQILLGSVAAKNQHKGIGDHLVINDTTYTISGIYDSGLSWQDAGAIVTLAESQKLQGIEGQFNIISVGVADGQDVRAIADNIEAAHGNLVAVVDIADYQAANEGTRIVKTISLTISLLAVIIGGIGVMNTIIMSVFERTREIGVLRALGWSRARVATMILSEALLMSLFAAAAGIGIGLLGTGLITLSSLGQQWLAIQYNTTIVSQALLVAVGVVMIGALYPAYRASRLSPTEALKYE